MESYRINRPICAVVSKDNVATSIPAPSLLRVFGPSRRVEGLVEVEYKGKRYAVFQADLDEFGAKIQSDNT